MNKSECYWQANNNNDDDNNKKNNHDDDNNNNNNNNNNDNNNNNNNNNSNNFISAQNYTQYFSHEQYFIQNEKVCLPVLPFLSLW